MTIQTFSKRSLLDFTLAARPGNPGATDPVRIGEKFAMPGSEQFRFGIWESAPGTFKRDTLTGELMFILSGVATFTHEGGDTVAFGAGDIVVFPPETKGTWVVIETLRKVYVMA